MPGGRDKETSRSVDVLDTPLLDATRAELARRTPNCAKLAADRSEVINAAMAASGAEPPAIFIESNDGARFTDIDANVYIDTCMGFGVHVLGHRHPLIEAALADQMTRGWHYSLRCPQQLNVANLVKEAGPNNDRVVFCNSGTEATLYALRAARAYSGKQKIGLFAYSYHGAHDQVLIWPGPGSMPDDPKKQIAGAGVPEEVSDLAILLPYRSDRAFDIIRANKADLAAIIVEPVQGSYPHPEVGPFLRELRAVCDEADILLIADEVLTGFRLGFGGAQEAFGFAADISTYGKALCGGLPGGVIAGRQDIMEVFSDFTQPKGIFFSGTFSGNPLSMAASSAVLSYLKGHPEIYDDMNAKGDRLRGIFNTYCQDKGYPIEMLGYGSLYQVFFPSEDAYIGAEIGDFHKMAEGAFYLHLLLRGVFVHATKRCFVSAAHTDEDIDLIAQAYIEALEAVASDGLIPAQ